jgi:cytochrome c
MAGAHVYGCRMIPARLALAVLLMAAAPPVLAKGDAARGERIARENCAPCHAVGRSGASPNPKAPRFRELSRRYPLQNLEEALAAQMPVFRLGVTEIDNLIAWLARIQTRARR